MATTNPRYQGRPLLRLLECYVLWAIGQVHEEEANVLKQMTPKLQSVYGVQGDWHEVIAAAVQLPPDTPVIIRNLWAKNSEIAKTNRTTLTPQQFAEMFVDQNFADWSTR